MKYEWRKQEKELYGVKTKAVLVDVPKQKFITIKGKGNPNEKGGEYQKAVEIVIRSYLHS